MPPKGPYAFEGPNGDLLHEVHQTFTGFLFGALGQNPRWTQSLAIADELPTRGNSAKAKMASRAYGVHEWLDERVKAKISQFDYEVTVKRWANAISLKIDDLSDEDANLGQFRTLINEMADDFVEHKHSLFIDLLNNGFTAARGLAYDGQFFFDVDHPITAGGIQSNKLTAVFTETSFYAAVKLMEETKKPNGLIANLIPTHGIFPTALRSVVETTFNKQYGANGSNNLLYQRIQPIFEPRLSSATAWYLLDATKALKPFFTVNRKPVTPQMSLGDEFEEGVAHWGANARYNASYGFYQTMVASDGTV